MISLNESTPKSCSCCTWKQVIILNRVFGQKFTRNDKNGFECLKLIWSGTFAIFNIEPLWFWASIGSRIKISHYIQPSSRSSALSIPKLASLATIIFGQVFDMLFKSYTTHCGVLIIQILLLWWLMFKREIPHLATYTYIMTLCCTPDLKIIAVARPSKEQFSMLKLFY